jgi:hypothetical protein
LSHIATYPTLAAALRAVQQLQKQVANGSQRLNEDHVGVLAGRG